MKILKYILGIIAVLLLIAVVIGFITPSISYDSEITVNKSVEEAWAVMNDESKVTQWLQDISKIEHVSGEKGTVGAVTRYTFSQDGQESSILETMKVVKPNEQVQMDFVMDGVMTMDYKMDYTDQGGKTILKSSTTTTGEGIMMRAMMPFMKGSMQAQEDLNMANLKKLIDENTTDYFPKADVVMDEVEMK